MKSEHTITKYIFVVRHGDSGFTSENDFKRNLSNKGMKACQMTSYFIEVQIKKNNLPQPSCISSSAIRTRQTANIILKDNYMNDVNFYDELYSTAPSNWLKLIAQHQSQNLVIVGHNPTLSNLINTICGENIYMKPANCALIRLEINPDGIIYPASLIEYHRNE